jgi:uncharacterized protein YyaL (SSP411 family)
MKMLNRKGSLALFSMLALTAAATAAQAQHVGGITATSSEQTNDSRIQWQSNVQSALEQATRENKLILVDVGANWCGWCQKMDQSTYSDKSVSNLLSRDFVCVKLDADSDPGKEFSQAFNIQGLPTVVILNPKSKTYKISVGYMNPTDFVAMITKVEQQMVAIAK